MEENKEETKKEVKTAETKKTVAKKTSKAKVATKKVEKTEKSEKIEKAVKTEKVNKTENKNDVSTAVATLKYARISSRKVKIVADLIRGKNVDEALAIVKFTPKASSEVIEKLLKSAIANAENNNNMSHSKLFISEIYANQGPTLRRIRPAAKGSAVRIRKRTSHITIVLKERD